MKLEKIETQAIAHYAYLIADGGEAAVVDPSRDVGRYLEAARRMNARIRYVVETHRQEDFVMGSAELARLTEAEIVNGDFDSFGHGDRRLCDGDGFELGGLDIVARHTPGHTPESMSYVVHERSEKRAWCVFTGDTLFFGETGRTDLPDAEASVENAGLLYDSVHQKLAGVGDTALVLPAHGPGSVCGSGMAARPWSTLGEEKQYNPVFTLGREEFAHRKGGERIPRPPYFRHMEQVNLEGGLPPVETRGRVARLDVEAFAGGAADGVVLDTREPEAFAGGHREGSYSIWLGGLPVFGGWVADPESRLYLITDRDEDVDRAASHLTLIGLDGVAAALGGGFGSWRSSGRPLARSGVITPRELEEKRSDFQVLDVREPDEFASGHIPGARQLYVGHLEECADELGFDRDRTVVVTCGVGHRAGLGVSMLLRHGFRDVRNLLGGMSAWKKLELSLEEGD